MTNGAEKAKIVLTAVTPEELLAKLPALTIEEARRVVAQVHREEAVSTPHAGIRRRSRELVVASGIVPSLDTVSEAKSTLDPFVKYALRTSDAHVIETVRIPLEIEGRFSVCVSSQVGCALACAFCATGRMGLSRNLETWEIVEQVRIVRRGLGAGHANGRPRVHGVVFQGMGEPMANLDRVLAAIAVMTEPSALAIDARAITVCTSGLPTGIVRLAREAPNVRLGLSIGSARTEARRRLMPIDRAHGLTEEVFEAACEHAEVTKLSPMWAVTLLAGVNDSREDAEALAALVARFKERTGKHPRLSVIPYNAIDEEKSDPFARSSVEAEAHFRDLLRDRGVFTHKRYSGGADVSAACGQLAARTPATA